jgi:hypothetical protein
MMKLFLPYLVLVLIASCINPGSGHEEGKKEVEERLCSGKAWDEQLNINFYLKSPDEFKYRLRINGAQVPIGCEASGPRPCIQSAEQLNYTFKFIVHYTQDVEPPFLNLLLTEVDEHTSAETTRVEENMIRLTWHFLDFPNGPSDCGEQNFASIDVKE